MDNEKIRAKRDELVQQREQLMKQHEALSRQLEQTEQRIIAHNGAIEALDELLKQAESEAAGSDNRVRRLAGLFRRITQTG